ncbi:cyclic 3',5'-adenosine monophosphate phosphodiesterase [Stieleria maiorica]|uniref:Cyclic 3',5'-adenosine monophosphate phosphodiesterase n=1 Tax=Stieleria maiorica TaxID=2795974 RepID=A0A5B9MMG6_9BACT|nr:LamG-like jellyroll fold domain-containing protein [Stieleria maiorica]QEG02493.1 cyclic 3',5'-adenosine monophosphate phosphodiesterase [Stieleria maiorica]
MNLSIRVTLFVAATLCSAAISPAHETAGGLPHNHDTPARVLTTRSTAKVIAPTVAEDGFQFIVYGDRTGGVPAGLKVLEQAVADTNLLDPDLVMTVGDLIQGYNETPEWLAQADEYKAIMNRLKMRWFPVAGNHDIYWRGENPAPPGHHESNYEKHFGPLWYSFRHKNAGFIVLYSDEGDPSTNLKAFNAGALQQMSQQQLDFLDKALEDLADQDHVFVFLHHPRWIGGGYTGSNWDDVHQRLADAGNVSAVFAGHIHKMRYDGVKDGIEYYALATTGGHIPNDTPIPGAGHLHHFNIVTVRPKRITVSSLPVGAVFDPKQFTPEFLKELELARSIRPKQVSDKVLLSVDGSARGTVKLDVTNPAEHPVEVTLLMSRETLQSGWLSTLDHQHITLDAGASQTVEFLIRRDASGDVGSANPAVTVALRYLGDKAAVDLPPTDVPIGIRLDQVPADYFASISDQALLVSDEASAIAVNDDAFELPAGPFTIETWIKPTQHKGFDAIIAKTQSSEYAFFSDHGVVQFDVHLGGRYVSAIGKEALPLNQWSHLAGVYDGSNVVLYVDGKRVASKSATGSRKSNQLPLYLGADPDHGGNPTRAFVGQLNEFRLSTGVRYDGDFTPAKRHQPDDSTVLLHHFDRSVGPFLLDHSASAANGRMGKSSRLVPVE